MSKVELVIGDCGSGKTTQATLYAVKYMKKNYPVYSNMFIKGAFKLDLSDLMQYELGEDAVVIIDEAASHGLNSRGTAYKESNKQNIIEFFTMYRHYLVKHVIVISPSFQDVIPIVRSRADIITCTKRSLFNFVGFNKTKRIAKKIDIDKQGGTEPREVYFWQLLSTRLWWRKSAFKIFNSFSRKELKDKEFEVW